MENILNGDFTKAGQNVIRNAMRESKNELDLNHSPHQLSDQERRIHELERQIAEKDNIIAEKDKIITEKDSINAILARKCGDIDWYKWLGKQATRFLAGMAAAWKSTHLTGLVNNPQFIKLVELVGKPFALTGHLYLFVGIIVAVLIFYWLLTTENKMLKIEAFIEGTYSELAKSPKLVTEMMDSLNRLLAFVKTFVSPVTTTYK